MASMDPIHDLALWDAVLEERSQGWYQLRAVRKTGNVFEQAGQDPEELIQKLREFEIEILEALEARKASG